MRIVSIFLVSIAIFFSQETSAGNITEFHIQLDLTPEARAFVETLSDENKEKWIESIPDSIPLQAICVLKMDSLPVHGIGIKIGTFEGLGDLFEGHYKESDSTETAITHFSSGEIHYLNLGNITGYKSFIALAWVADSQGMPIEIARFEKN